MARTDTWIIHRQNDFETTITMPVSMVPETAVLKMEFYKASNGSDKIGKPVITLALNDGLSVVRTAETAVISLKITDDKTNITEGDYVTDLLIDAPNDRKNYFDILLKIIKRKTV